MRIPTTQVLVVQNHLCQEFGGFVILDLGPCAPLTNAILEVVEPMQSFDYWEGDINPETKNLEDGWVPLGRYQVKLPPINTNSVTYCVFVSLLPLEGGQTVRVMVGRRFNKMTVDWRAVKRVMPTPDPRPEQTQVA